MMETIKGSGEILPIPALSAQSIDMRYPNGTVALDDVNLTIQSGEFISLLGPSGCGKSTLLKMFAGLENPSQGQLSWWGQTFDTTGSTNGWRISMVFQEPTLMPWATIEENVRLPLDLAKIPRLRANQLVAEALEGVGLSKFGKFLPRELSGGMQMRASLARAIVTKPDLLLLDEPFGALDEFTRNRLDSDLRELWQKNKMTVVFVTHSIYEAVFISSRVVVMQARPGKIIANMPIDGPIERNATYRISDPFIQQCKTLSELIAYAHQTDVV